MSIHKKNKEKVKFYELTKLEQEAGQMQDIYKKIEQQGQYMEDLLAKYNGLPTENPINHELEKEKERSRTLEVKSQRSSILSNRSGLQDKHRLVALELPNIKTGVQSAKKNINKVNKTGTKERTTSAIDNPKLNPKNIEERQQLKKNLQQAYQVSKSQKPQILSIQSSRLQKARQNNKVSKSRANSAIKSELLFEGQDEERGQETQIGRTPKYQKNIPQPLGLELGYFSKREYSESSSEEGEVPLTYYQKEYRQMIRNQCLQETNFLYFSKNQSMHNWTQGLLLLFQKHDKELASLRKRCKYLQKFDNTFFSIDIFKND